ncbi:uncharacterized protein [Asterias amurensis]|uniref:uncharacterized protein n=1 Tax=Asterias amurensis TaxID=7602 RepID=UPI003AB85E36
MTVIMSTLLAEIFLVVVFSEGVSGACQRATRDYQMHQGNIIALYPSPMQDHVLKDIIYQEQKASSDVVCAVYCLQDELCKSFNYCNDKFCQLKAYNYSVNGSAIQPSAGCRHYGGEELLADEAITSEGTPFCAQNTYLFHTIELQLQMASPLRLEFTVNIGYDVLYVISVHLKGLYGDVTAGIKKWDSSSQLWREVLFERRDYIGVPVIMTYDNGRFELAVQGVLDSTMAYDVTSPHPSWCLTDIQHRICLANAAFNTFTKLWMQPRKISITLLMHVYNAMVLSVFMYNSSSSWAAPQNVLEKLDTCHRRHLRRILRCRRPSSMSNIASYLLYSMWSSSLIRISEEGKVAHARACFDCIPTHPLR